MKQFCDLLMKLNTSMPYGTDFSPIVLALFLREKKIMKNRKYEISEFNTYLYRFYSDIQFARINHYNKMINSLWHYQPQDFYSYTEKVLQYVHDNTGLINIMGNEFILAYCPDELEKYTAIIDAVIRTLAAKYIGQEYQDYCSEITPEEYCVGNIFDESTRIFNRAIEKLNYCFICDKHHISELCAVKLSDIPVYNDDVCLLMCKEHAQQYIDGDLLIGRNGYPYINGKRMYQHLPISVLKRIRKNLKDLL